MKKVLFCVDSYFQLIGSIGLRLNRYRDWDADAVIYNTTPSAGKICRMLRKEKVFHHTYFADTMLARVGDNYSWAEKFPKYFIYVHSIVRPEKICSKILGTELSGKYDHLIFQGHGAIVECIFNTCYRKNYKIRCYRIDDGLGTYLKNWVADKWKIRIIFEKIVYFICNYKHIENYIAGYYVAEPDMMTVKLRYPLIKLPDLSRKDKEYTSILNRVFHYHYQKLFEKKKIIFFGTWGKGVEGDRILIRILKEIVPAKEMLIKTHPRENKEKYGDLGIEIMEQSEIPWEVVMLNHDFSKSIFITAGSSAVFTSRMYFRKTGIDIYAYACLGEKYCHVPDTISVWRDLYIKKYNADCIFVPSSLTEFKEIVRNLICTSE